MKEKKEKRKVRQAINGYRLVQARYGTVNACCYDGSKAFTVLFFRAGGNSIFSTTDVCTVKLALATKLIIHNTLGDLG